MVSHVKSRKSRKQSKRLSAGYESLMYFSLHKKELIFRSTEKNILLSNLGQHVCH